MAQKPARPKGTRDFSHEEVAKRNYIMETIKRQFELFGFQPIETPSFEKSSTLLGKYGEEGDRLIFKILNNGDYLKKVPDETLDQRELHDLTAKISGKALRYDLTVPFARYVVQHQNELNFPYKRYQIQPVWRADRPQKGRYREFFQCDADVIGSRSLWQEVEFVRLYDAVFSALHLDGVTLNLNNRKILAGLADVMEASDKLVPFTVALDKLDKIGEERVKTEMQEHGISEDALNRVDPIFSMTGDFKTKLDQLRDLLSGSEIGQAGIEELEFIRASISQLPLQGSTLNIDVTLARGLDYYTGAILEVSAPENVDMGSIGGGGRYDDLTGIFGLKHMSGMGISFGLDRIYLVLEALDLFPATVTESTQVMFVNFGETEAFYAMKTLMRLRKHGISAELYPDAAKMKKQMDYANKRDIPFVVLAGSKEIREQKFTVKDMKRGDQSVLSFGAMFDRISSKGKKS